MSLKNLLRQWLFPASEVPIGDRGANNRCPLGHWLDPSWSECPRCKAESLAAHRAARPRITQAETGEQKSLPLVLRGVLVTFSWNPRGELFPVREGDTTIGAVAIDSASGDACDICIPQDNLISGRHARIRCRGDDIVLTDLESSNGTLVDHERVGAGGAPLGAEARITTGRTVWQFLRVEDPGLRPAVSRLHVDRFTRDSDSDERLADTVAADETGVPDEAVGPLTDSMVDLRNEVERSSEGEAARSAANRRRQRDPTRFGDEPETIPIDTGRERPTRVDELQVPSGRSPTAPGTPDRPDAPPRRRGTRFE